MLSERLILISILILQPQADTSSTTRYPMPDNPGDVRSSKLTVRTKTSGCRFILQSVQSDSIDYILDKSGGGLSGEVK